MLKISPGLHHLITDEVYEMYLNLIFAFNNRSLRLIENNHNVKRHLSDFFQYGYTYIPFFNTLLECHGAVLMASHLATHEHDHLIMVTNPFKRECLYGDLYDFFAAFSKLNKPVILENSEGSTFIIFK